MKNRLFSFCIIIAFLAVSFLNLSFVIADEENLIIYNSTVDFKHFGYQTDDNFMLVGYDENNIVTTTFNTMVIENPYIKVTLLPEFGGRILSIIYKPTGHELLYQNPIGTPYGIEEGNFYYNWLMVYGGIFPTFPEPEHGKAWGLPWEAEIIEKSDEKISVSMSFTDEISPVTGVPAMFDNGNTGMTCVSTVTVYKDKSYVEYNIQLVNNRNEPVKYEYWTCLTLAPGSEPGNTICPPDTEMVVPIDKVLLRDNWWPWMGSVDKAIDAKEHIFEYKNLALFKNWSDMGIAYASPSVDKDWWGVINQENKEGILRIANNKETTPGLKFWTWGINSQNTDPATFGDSSRPYIELWGGHSSEFFADTIMEANKTKVWDEYYIPTVGLAKITNASKNGAAYLEYDIDDASVNFTSEVFTTHPGKELKISLILEGNENLPLIENNFISSSDKPDTFTVSVSEASIQDGFSLLALEVKDVNDEVLISAEIPFGDKDQEEAAVNNNIAEEPEIEPNKETESQTKIEPEKESNPALIIILAVLAIIVTVILSLYFIRNKKKKASS
jgi:hypothetical protein